MDIEKIRKWLQITNEYKKTDFWTRVLEEKYPDEMVRMHHFQPKYDIYQNEHYTFIIFEIPGVDRESLSLHLISNTQLKISGIIHPFLILEKEIIRERTYGEFERIINLPEAAHAQHMHIQINDGLLQISYPRNIELVHFTLNDHYSS
ncbi:Hsp20/alpha crystallin family protein [Niallia oryzisoli]|uniref:Hsp20/alpha crystallin family protein n=1 Tax=Niallia oryzisoli TaxID=1737571 RepID=UPI0037356043